MGRNARTDAGCGEVEEERSEFGSALALQHDVVQEAFLTAWSPRPSVADAAAFPGWPRGTHGIRHSTCCVRSIWQPLPLTEAEEVPAEDPAQDHRLLLQPLHRPGSDAAQRARAAGLPLRFGDADVR
jgi:hypothetical protein